MDDTSYTYIYCVGVIFLETSQSAAGFIETVNQFYDNLESQESFEHAQVWSMLTDDEEYKIAFRKVLKLILTRHLQRIIG